MTIERNRRRRFLLLLSGGAPAIAPTITSSAPANPVYGVAYSHQYTVSAETTLPVTWSVSAGSLPTGLSLNSSTGVLSGTPTTPGTFSWTVTATNTGGTDTDSATVYVSYLELGLSVRADILVALWPLSETSGTNADDPVGGHDGTSVDVVWADATFGDGTPAPRFNGSGARIQLPASTLNTALTAIAALDEFSMAFWFKVSAGTIWTDATLRNVVQIGADVNNRHNTARSANNNQMRGQGIIASGSANSDFTVSATTWLHGIYTSSKSANQRILYINNVAGSTGTVGTNTFAGALNAAWCSIGTRGSASTAEPWNGWIKYVSLYAGILNSTNRAALYVAGLAA